MATAMHMTRCVWHAVYRARCVWHAVWLRVARQLGVDAGVLQGVAADLSSLTGGKHGGLDALPGADTLS